MQPTSPTTIQDICTQLGITPRRERGQNFLIDEEALEDIVAAANLSKKDTVLEIGPGFGVLTHELAKRAGTVIAVELDQKLAQHLQQEFKTQHNVTVVHNDIFRYLNLEILQYSKVVANLPYQITSRILRVLLEHKQKPGLIVVMVQKEVAERIVAKPGAMSMLSVMVQYYAEPEIVRIVPRTSFWPVPEVDSAILRITPHLRRGFGGQAHLEEVKDFFRIAKAGFASRRKQLQNNLASLGFSREFIYAALDTLGLPHTARAQELSVEQWKGLVHTLNHSNTEARKHKST